MKPETVELISKAAVEAAMEFMEKERQRKQREKIDRRRRNTKLLLKNYRGFVKHGKEAEEKFKVIRWDEELGDLLSEEFTVESIRKSKARTLAIVRFIQQMLVAYKAICDATGKQEEIRRYQVIESLYISESKLSVEQIAEIHNVEVRTVYNDINNACEALSVLIFGVDAIQFE